MFWEGLSGMSNDGDKLIKPKLNYVQRTDLWPQIQNRTANKVSSRDSDDTAFGMHGNRGKLRFKISGYRREGSPSRSLQSEQPIKVATVRTAIVLIGGWRRTSHDRAPTP